MMATMLPFGAYRSLNPSMMRRRNRHGKHQRPIIQHRRRPERSRQLVRPSLIAITIQTPAGAAAMAGAAAELVDVIIRREEVSDVVPQIHRGILPGAAGRGGIGRNGKTEDDNAEKKCYNSSNHIHTTEREKGRSV